MRYFYYLVNNILEQLMNIILPRELHCRDLPFLHAHDMALSRFGYICLLKLLRSWPLQQAVAVSKEIVVHKHVLPCRRVKGKCHPPQARHRHTEALLPVYQRRAVPWRALQAELITGQRSE